MAAQLGSQNYALADNFLDEATVQALRHAEPYPFSNHSTDSGRKLNLKPGLIRDPNPIPNPNPEPNPNPFLILTLNLILIRF